MTACPSGADSKEMIDSCAVIDWYALSLSNLLLAWRDSDAPSLSQIAYTAARVSGSMGTPYSDRVMVGTKARQLRSHKGSITVEDFPTRL
jgi:hypothetical protein